MKHQREAVFPIDNLREVEFLYMAALNCEPVLGRRMEIMTYTKCQKILFVNKL